jgi:hypothetical protein
LIRSSPPTRSCIAAQAWKTKSSHGQAEQDHSFPYLRRKCFHFLSSVGGHVYPFLRPSRSIFWVQAEAGPEVGQPFLRSLFRKCVLNNDIPVFQEVRDILRYQDIERQLINLQEASSYGKDTCKGTP